MIENVKPLKNSNEITEARSPSPKTGRHNSNIYNNLNNTSTNSKYNYSTSKKQVKSKIKNSTLEFSNNKNLFNTYENESKNSQILSANVRIQNKILEEYQKWVNILLLYVDTKKINYSYNDIGTPIQQCLENIEKLKNKNFEIKALIINKKLDNENMENILEKKIRTQNMIIKEFNEKDKSNGENIKKEKEQLKINVQMLANELDELNENNKQLYDKIQNNNNLKKIYELYTLRDKLKEENKLYKKIMVLKNRKNLLDLQESMSLSLDKSNSFMDLKNKKYDSISKTLSNIDIDKREYGSIGPLSGFGEYKLEKEENINSIQNAFFCGL